MLFPHLLRCSILFSIRYNGALLLDRITLVHLVQEM